MLDADRMMRSLLGYGVAARGAGGRCNGLLGTRLGEGCSHAVRRALASEGLAKVGHVAWEAWQRHGRPATLLRERPGTGQRPTPPAYDLRTRPQEALRVLQAMIAAVKAEGGLDPDVKRVLVGRVRELVVPAAEQQFLLEQLSRAFEPDEVVREARPRELALQMYAGSALIVYPASRAERAWLDLLAARLDIDPELAEEIDRSVARSADDEPSPGPAFAAFVPGIARADSLSARTAASGRGRP